MKQKVLNTVSLVTRIPASDLEAKMDTQGQWDSFTQVEIIFQLESELGVFFEQEEIAEMKTPRRILEFVEKKQFGSK